MKNTDDCPITHMEIVYMENGRIKGYAAELDQRRDTKYKFIPFKEDQDYAVAFTKDADARPIVSYKVDY